MRSDLVFKALSQVTNRYQLCQLASKATRKLHKPNTRLQDTTNEVLGRFETANPGGQTPKRRQRPNRWKGAARPNGPRVACEVKSGKGPRVVFPLEFVALSRRSVTSGSFGRLGGLVSRLVLRRLNVSMPFASSPPEHFSLRIPPHTSLLHAGDHDHRRTQRKKHY